ncbi:MAG: hypothetical protein JWP10_1032, partial [Nocardioidaceae bacterium]|nr:hypothetical protein [Nocardioidaceae bacterium]
MQPLFRIAISTAIAALSVSACTDAQAAEPDLRVEVVQSGLEIPWDIAFLGNGAML